MNQQTLRVLFFGTPLFSAAALKALLDNPLFAVCGVVTQPDKPAGRGQTLQISAVKKIALEHQLAIFQPKKIRGLEPEFLQEIATCGPVDFAVVVAFGQILPQAILDYPKFCCINVHASLLPRWRGAAPIQRALLAGDKETGVCIMKMEAGLDTGPVYSRQSIAITENDTTASLHDSLAHLGATLLIQTLPKIADGSLRATQQENEGVNYAEKITSSDLLINWHDSSEELTRKIRTFSPKPAAYCMLEGKRLKVLKSSIATEKRINAVPGSIIAVLENGIMVQTGNGSLCIQELQLEGKRAMAVSEFIKGYPGLEGKLLGS